MANKITIVRALLVPVFVTSMVYASGEEGWSLWLPLTIFIAACLTDAIDGYIARTRCEQTLFGQVLDPIADKLLLISAFLCIFFSPFLHTKPPAWVVILIVSRDFFIVAGILVIYMTTGQIRSHPSWLGKVTTFSQMLSVISLLTKLKLAPFFWTVTALLTLVSGFAYLWREMNRVKTHAVS